MNIPVNILEAFVPRRGVKKAGTPRFTNGSWSRSMRAAWVRSVREIANELELDDTVLVLRITLDMPIKGTDGKVWMTAQEMRNKVRALCNHYIRMELHAQGKKK